MFKIIGVRVNAHVGVDKLLFEDFAFVTRGYFGFPLREIKSDSEAAVFTVWEVCLSVNIATLRDRLVMINEKSFNFSFCHFNYLCLKLFCFLLVNEYLVHNGVILNH